MLLLVDKISEEYTKQRGRILCLNHCYTQVTLRDVTSEQVMTLTHITYLLTYLPTPWSRVLLEKQTGLQLVKKFPALYETRRFITALTSAHHLFLLTCLLAA
jgi:hypothetical protein